MPKTISNFIAMKKNVGLVLLILVAFGYSKAQTLTTKPANPTLIQFSGVVLDQDSLTPIPFVSILIKGTGRGTICNFQGFFSLIVNPGDELEFHSVSRKY